MDRLYAAGCHGQPGFTHCEPFVKAATFGPSQTIALTLLCDFLNRFVLNRCNLSKFYGSKFSSLPVEEQRRLTGLHVGVFIKVTTFTLLGGAIYLSLWHGLTWEDRGWLGLTVAEMVNLCVMSFPGLYLFELISTPNMRPLDTLHHFMVIGWILGSFYVLLTLSPAHSLASLEQAIHVCKISVGMCLFSGIFGAITRATFILRTLCPRTSRFLAHAFLLGVVAVAVLIVSEALLIMYLVISSRSELPPAAPYLFGLVQAVFSAAKAVNGLKVRNAWRRQVGEARARAVTPPPVVVEKAGGGKVGGL